MVKPAWLELWNDYLKTRPNRERGPGLAVVQERVISREAHGKMEFSRPDRSDENEWDETDHYGYFLFWVKKLNTESNQGVFFRKAITENRMDQIVWSLKSYLQHQHTHSQINRPMEDLGQFMPRQWNNVGYQRTL